MQYVRRKRASLRSDILLMYSDDTLATYQRHDNYIFIIFIRLNLYKNIRAFLYVLTIIDITKNKIATIVNVCPGSMFPDDRIAYDPAYAVKAFSMYY